MADGALASPPQGVSADWTIPQGWEAYTAEDHATWLTLYDRQQKLLPGRACDAFLKGLDALDLRGEGIPDFLKVSERLTALTGWSVVAVPGLVPDAVFFDHLAHRRFPAGNFIRKPDQLDYLEEPDVFHDVFGHVPMLTDPVFADYMQKYGVGAGRALKLGQLENLARLYWYTVEFGLMQEHGGLRIYGAGIVSSAAETVFALEADDPNRIAFDLERVMKTPYRIDDFQQVYFVIPSLEDLRETTLQDFGPLYDRLKGAEPLGITQVMPSDGVLTHGTQRYAAERAASAAG